MLPQNIVQDAKGPIQLHRTRLNPTRTELSIPLQRSNVWSSFDALGFPIRVDQQDVSLPFQRSSPGRHFVVKKGPIRDLRGQRQPRLHPHPFKSLELIIQRDVTHNEDFGRKLRVYGGKHIVRADNEDAFGRERVGWAGT